MGALAVTTADRVIAVAETAPLQVRLIAKSEFFAPPDVPWSTDADGGQALVEFAMVAPLFLLVLFTAIDISRLLYAYTAISSAARPPRPTAMRSIR